MNDALIAIGGTMAGIILGFILGKDKTMNDELKPCPFCGGEARLKIKAFDVLNTAAFVECKKCHARTDLIEAGLHYTAVDRAKRFWNRRIIKG